MNNIFKFQIFLFKQFHNVFMLAFGTKISKIILISKFILVFACMKIYRRRLQICMLILS